MAWLKRVLVAFDQCWNAIFNGSEDETISSRVGKTAECGSRFGIALEALIDLPFAVFFGQRDHCRASIERDEG